MNLSEGATIALDRKIGDGFRQYLREGHVPHYVEEYVHRDHRASDRTYQKLLFPGGRPPYL